MGYHGRATAAARAKRTRWLSMWASHSMCASLSVKTCALSNSASILASSDNPAMEKGGGHAPQGRRKGSRAGEGRKVGKRDLGHGKPSKRQILSL